MRLRRRPRPALTLLEVVIALSIFLVAMVGLHQLVNMGSERALDVQLQAQASLQCQSKMAEVVAGAQPLETTQLEALTEDNPPWQWAMEAREEFPGCWYVRVWVQKELAGGRIVQASLNRYLVPPDMRGSTFDRPVELSTPPPADPAASSSSSSSSSDTGGAP